MIWVKCFLWRTKTCCRIIVYRNVNLPCPLCIQALLTLLTSQCPPEKHKEMWGSNQTPVKLHFPDVWGPNCAFFLKLNFTWQFVFPVWHWMNWMNTKRKGICRSPYHLYVPAPLGCQIHPYNQNIKTRKSKMIEHCYNFCVAIDTWWLKVPVMPAPIRASLHNLQNHKHQLEEKNSPWFPAVQANLWSQ